MCDYSLDHLQNRLAKVHDCLVVKKFLGTSTRGFGLSAYGASNTVICLRPGTEIEFDDDVMVPGLLFGDWWLAKIRSRKAIFRQVNLDDPLMNHDALEFACGKVVLLTRLRAGQCAIVRQLPAPETLPIDRTLNDSMASMHSIGS